ncbi:hypothetical protein [Polyangium aurulentum]|uniref:hypothetical protein n=1 Tax=Polyangium aurulentum TaxID=2567896 RepID=UPI00200EB864|nr:hypothetical protein [Polyangium aurulentum]
MRSAAFIENPRQWLILERPYRRELVELCLRMAPHVEPREAKGLLQRALALDPDDARRWLTELESIFEDVPQLERQRLICTRALGLGADMSIDGTTERVYRAEIDKRFRALFMEVAESFLGERRGYTKALAWYRKARRVGGDSTELLLRQIEVVATYQRDHWQVVDLCDRLLAMVPNHPQASRFKEQAQKAMRPRG